VRSENDQSSTDLTGEVAILGEVIEPKCSGTRVSRLAEALTRLDRISLPTVLRSLMVAVLDATTPEFSPSSTNVLPSAPPSIG
jgi:hypothetical protein